MSNLTPDQEELQKILNTDPLAEAERLTGDSYKKNEGTLALGMLMQMDHVATKRQALEARGDTCYGTKVDEYLNIVQSEGFEVVLHEAFEDVRPADHYPTNYKDELYILWHPDGILSYFDTYGVGSGSGLAPSVNSGDVGFNWEPTGEKRWPDHTSGHYVGYDNGRILLPGEDSPTKRLILIGSHDAREAFRHRLAVLRQNGRFVLPWIESPWLWLTGYGEEMSDSPVPYLKSIERFQKLPEHIRRNLAVAESAWKQLLVRHGWGKEIGVTNDNPSSLQG